MHLHIVYEEIIQVTAPAIQARAWWIEATHRAHDVFVRVTTKKVATLRSRHYEILSADHRIAGISGFYRLCRN
jgi:hypothetical protein